MKIEDFNKLPVFDEESANNLRELLGTDYDAMLQEFIATTPALIEEFELALKGNDVAQVSAIAHKLKSGAGNLGLHAFYRMFDEIESAARSGGALDFNQLPDIVQEQLRIPNRLSTRRPDHLSSDRGIRNHSWNNDTET